MSSCFPPGIIGVSTLCCRHYIRSPRSMASSPETAQGRPPMDVRTTPLFTVTLKVPKIQNLGKTPLGERRVAVIAAGRFEGPKLNGTVAEGGSDWTLARPDGAWQLDVRLTLKTDDGHLIGTAYPGLRHGPAAA